ncbi:MAG TPA: Arc family DNA-binding protein [Gaiellaceae bacterium]|nr:Arc family DNA-binding protein [Gaiellaceae bacterium]
MAAFHVRDIPPDLLERLRERAAENGRSMNSELLSILDSELSRPTPEEWLRRIDEALEHYGGRPLDPPPEVLIREDRDSR